MFYIFLGKRRGIPWSLGLVQGISCLGALQSRNSQVWVVCVRLGALALKVETTPYLPAVAFETEVEWIDSFWPGELGEIHHGKEWKDDFCTAALELHEENIMVDIQRKLPALKIPHHASLFNHLILGLNPCVSNAHEKALEENSYGFCHRKSLLWADTLSKASRSEDTQIDRRRLRQKSDTDIDTARDHNQDQLSSCTQHILSMNLAGVFDRDRKVVSEP